MLLHSATETWVTFQVKLVDDSGAVVPRGECGELWFRGYGILKEYRNADPQLLKNIISEDGYLKTG